MDELIDIIKQIDSIRNQLVDLGREQDKPKKRK